MSPLHTPSARSLRPLLLACACLLACVAPARAQPGRLATDIRQMDELLSKGRQALARSDDQGAVEIFRDAVKRFPDYSSPWYWLGVALRRAGNFDESVTSLERSLKLRRPDSTTVRAEMAYTLLLAGQNERAVTEGRRAFGAAAQKAEPHYITGLLYLNHAFPDPDAPARALQEAEAAVAADPNFAQAYLLKTQALVSLPSHPSDANWRDAEARRLAEAAQSLEKFLALAPGAEGFAFWQQQLSALRAQGDEMRAPEASRTIFNAKELTTKAVITRRPEPLYSEEARRTQTFGSLRVRLVLGADGSVQHVLALGGLPNGLTERAVEAARSIQFNPATKDGRPASQFVIVEYNFDIF
jgi:tetratricopeptide (TPR) repeat protein